MLIQAHGKINLSLDITGRRENGYHDIATVMQMVTLCDEVEITRNDSGAISVETDCNNLSGGEDNIAYKACQLMKTTYGLEDGFDIVIQKRIPLAGGMAGGSTDAAAVIRGINALCELKKSDEELMQIGLKIGADVPFCIQQNPALATGIGEILSPVSGLPSDIWILLVNPGVEVSTKQIYEAIDKQATYATIDNGALVQALAASDMQQAKQHMINIMEPVTGALCPQVPELIHKLKQVGAFHAMMSGSGATCFGLFEKEPDIGYMQKQFTDCFVSVAKPFFAS